MTTEQPPQVGADSAAAGPAPGKAVDPGSGSAVDSGRAPVPDAGTAAKPGTGTAAEPTAEPDAPPASAAGTSAGPPAESRPPKPARRWFGLRGRRVAKPDPVAPGDLRPTVSPPSDTPSTPSPSSQSTKDRSASGHSPDQVAGAAQPSPLEAFPTNGSPGDPVTTDATSPAGPGNKRPTTTEPDSKAAGGDTKDTAKKDTADNLKDENKDRTNGPAKTEPAKTDPSKTEPGRTEPGKTEPSKTEAAAAGGKGTRRRKSKLPSTRPPGAPPDPWTVFAETSERGPGRIRRALRAVGRPFIHEYALVAYGSLILAVLLTWPTLRYPLHTFPQDIWDPSRQAWQISWAGHILITEPVRLWQSNAFFPEAYGFAFGDSLLGYAPAGMIGSGPLAAVLRYNILFVLAHTMLTIGGYALVRQLGAGRTGAIVGAVAFAYAPWRLAQEGHLDIISAGGIPLALAMLARGHGWSMRYGFRPGRRHAGWATVGWLVATWQISLGFSLGLPFAYVLGALNVILALAVLVHRLRRRSPGPVLGWRLLLADLLGMLIFAWTGLLMAVPYVRVPDTTSAGTEIRFFSAPLRALLIGPAESRIWGAAHATPRHSLGWPAEMALLPGFVLYALALVGLVFSVWRMWHRLLLLVAVVISVILTLGTTFFEGRWTYLPLFGHLPASFGVRIPGRLMLWVTLLLAVLAAGAVAEFVRRAEHLAAHRVPPWPGPWLRLATLVPLLLVLVETWNATAHPVVPDQPTAMRTVASPMLVLPTTALTDQTVMLWSTSRFQPVANGSGGFAARRQSELRRSVATFPDVASVEYLRRLRIDTVLLLRDQVVGTPWERAGDIPVETLGIRREDLDDNSVLFHLDLDTGTPQQGTGTPQPGTSGAPQPGTSGAPQPGAPGIPQQGTGTPPPGIPGLPQQGTPGIPGPGTGTPLPGTPGIPGLGTGTPPPGTLGMPRQGTGTR